MPKPIDILTNYEHSKAILANRCVPSSLGGCGKDVRAFRDAISQREYRISGLCQECQDLVFYEQYDPYEAYFEPDDYRDKNDEPDDQKRGKEKR